MKNGVDHRPNHPLKKQKRVIDEVKVENQKGTVTRKLSQTENVQ